MKSVTLIGLVFIIAFLSNLSYAQVDVNITLPKTIKQHFERTRKEIDLDKVEKIEVIKDSNNTFISISYEQNGDSKKVIYKNDAYLCLETNVNLEYCPKSIIAALDTLASGFILTKLDYVQYHAGDSYRAIVTKGKRKKMEKRDFYFTNKGILRLETEHGKLPTKF